MQRLVDNNIPTDLRAFFQELVDVMPDLVFVKNMQGVYIGCNRAFRDLVGLPEEKIIGRTTFDLFPADVAIEFEAKDHQALLDQKTVSSETWVSYADGRRACFEVLRSPFAGEQRAVSLGLIGLCRDITERKWGEAALLESEHRFRNIMEFAPLGMGIIDLSGRFIEVNRALCQMLGYTPEVFCQLTAQQLTHPSDVAADMYYKKRLIAGEISSLQVDKRVQHKDGHWLPVRLTAVLHRSPAEQPLFLIGQMQDLSEQRAAEEREHVLSAVLENIFDGVMTIDTQGILHSFNKAAENIFGYAASEVIGKNVCMLMPEPYRSAHGGYIQKYLETRQETIIGIGRELVAQHKNGTVFPIDLAISEIDDPDLHHFIGVVRDITEKKENEIRIQHLAYYDALTDLPNRIMFEERLSRAMLAVKRDSNKIALMFVDLDNFKPVNDSLGHQIGDLLLKGVAQRLLMCIRDSDTVARIGGDEFVILLSRIRSADAAIAVANKLLESLRQPFELMAHRVNISASIGVALNTAQNCDPECLVHQADDAMYQAKSKGGNNVVLYSSN